MDGIHGLDGVGGWIDCLDEKAVGGKSLAMSCTPGCLSCMNSNSLLTTVRRNFQC